MLSLCNFFVFVLVFSGRHADQHLGIGEAVKYFLTARFVEFCYSLLYFVVSFLCCLLCAVWQDVDYVCISDNYWLGERKPCITYGLRYFSVISMCLYNTTAAAGV